MNAEQLKTASDLQRDIKEAKDDRDELKRDKSSTNRTTLWIPIKFFDKTIVSNLEQIAIDNLEFHIARMEKEFEAM